MDKDSCIDPPRSNIGTDIISARSLFVISSLFFSFFFLLFAEKFSAWECLKLSLDGAVDAIINNKKIQNANRRRSIYYKLSVNPLHISSLT